MRAGAEIDGALQLAAASVAAQVGEGFREREIAAPPGQQAHVGGVPLKPGAGL